jgi:hypothetical protein
VHEVCLSALYSLSFHEAAIPKLLAEDTVATVVACMKHSPTIVLVQLFGLGALTNLCTDEGYVRFGIFLFFSSSNNTNHEN